jgi:hypothetical protein
VATKAPLPLPFGRGEIISQLNNFNEGMKNKTKYIKLRVTEDEKADIVRMAAGYSSVSAFILDAARHFDDRLGQRKLEAMDRFAEQFTGMERTVAGVANNINQLAHYANSMRLMDRAQPGVIAEFNRLTDEWNSLLKLYITENKRIIDNIKN